MPTSDVKVSGYHSIPFIPFVLAVSVVSLPIVYLKTTGQQEWVWRYIFLITLTLVVYYSEDLTTFSRFIGQLEAQAKG